MLTYDCLARIRSDGRHPSKFPREAEVSKLPSYEPYSLKYEEAALLDNLLPKFFPDNLNLR